MAGERGLAGALVIGGLRIAFRGSPEPYDPIRTYRTYGTHSDRSLGQLAAAAALIPLGDKTPLIARYVRRRRIR
jgi:hypothetical protein